MFGYDDVIILISDVGEVFGSTLDIYEVVYMGSSDGSLTVLMMSQLRVYLLRTHLDRTLKLYWVLLMELKISAKHWEYHLDIFRLRLLALKKAWYLELVKYTCNCRQFQSCT